MKFAFIMLLGLAAIVGNAQADSMALASELGTVLAAEQPCHLSYDTGAIQNYISKHVPESDMSFGSMLETMVEGNTIEIQQMTPATLTALCAQTERVARFNDFIR